MPDKKTEEFDLRVRSMLSDAGMKPSGRVWKGISARLDAEAAPAPAANPFAWAKWAGVCLAAAAAIAAGVFLFDPIPTYQNIQKEETIAQAAVSRKQPAEQADATVAAPAPKAVSKPAGAAAEKIADMPADSQRETEKTTQEASAEQPEPSAERQEPTAEAGRVAESAEKQVSSTAFSDPFARMAYEDSKATRRPMQISVGGTLGANDADFTSTARVSRLASSISSSKSGITELGDSSFGIPFTLGVGVRFYLAPRFSIGTGLDYSLLTRSFEGRYNNINGGIIEQTASGTFFHAMHYIGIPVNFYYDFLSGDKIKFYGYAGGAGEYCVANKYHLYSEKFTYSEPVDGVQWSLGAGLGVEFKLNDFLGVYVDPAARYYFESQHPRNVRTEHPILFNLNAGLRFNF